METTQFGVSCCQRCRHFTLEGRRGGHCDQLNVPVQGRWSACPLAHPVFMGPMSTVTHSEVAHWPDVLVLPRREKVMAEIVDGDCLAESA
jgi:hypothetical protein